MVKFNSQSAKAKNRRLAAKFLHTDERLKAAYGLIDEIVRKSRSCGDCCASSGGICKILHDMVPEGGKCAVPTPEFNSWKERL